MILRWSLESPDMAAVVDIYSCVQNYSTAPCGFPMISMVNKLCNIECCVNNMFRINKKMIVSRGLELILSMFRRTTISDQHPLI